MQNKHKRNRLIFVSVIALISLVALLFIVQNFRDEIVFFYSPKELKNVEILNKISSRTSRIGGLVIEGSVKRIDALTTEFIVTDLEDDAKIVYKGLLPNLFRGGQGVVARGIYDKEKKLFVAEELLVKHDEKYMPPEVAKSIKHGKNL